MINLILEIYTGMVIFWIVPEVIFVLMDADWVCGLQNIKCIFWVLIICMRQEKLILYLMPMFEPYWNTTLLLVATCELNLNHVEMLRWVFPLDEPCWVFSIGSCVSECTYDIWINIWTLFNYRHWIAVEWCYLLKEGDESGWKDYIQFNIKKVF